MRRRAWVWILGVVGLVLVIGLVVRGRAQQTSADGKARGAAAGAPVPVIAGVATQEDVPVYLQGVGTVQAWQTVTVRSRIDGQLQKVAFQEGQDVKEGDLLAVIDPRPYQAALGQAVAKKAQDEAQLQNAKQDLQRYQILVEKNLQQRQTLDAQASTVHQLEALVRRGDQAVLDNARVNLTYTQVTSPIQGRTGIRLVDQGNIVHAGDANGLVVITQLSPIALIFTLPEQHVGAINQAQSQAPLKVSAMSADGKSVLDEGTLVLVDNRIDVSTGTLKLKAQLPNSKSQLWPGAFVNARLLLTTRQGATVVPAPAVQRGPQGTYIYVIGNGNTVQLRPVEVLQTQNGKALIEKGLQPGEQVVVDGQYKLQPGSKVTVQAPPAAPGGGREPRSSSVEPSQQAPAAGAPAPPGPRLPAQGRDHRGQGREALAPQRQGQGGEAPGRDPSVSISTPFIKRPVATSLLAIGVLLMGLLGYSLLPISALPEVSFPTLQVTTQLPGAGPETMATLVTTPLERQFGQIPGLDVMTSTSSSGISVITLQFVLERDIDAAAADVQAAINAAGGVLPKNLPSPPTYNKVNPADTPILILAVTSDALPLTQVNDFADSVLAQKLSRVTGVGLVTLEGGQKPAVRVRINPTQLAAMGLSMEDVRTAVGRANVNQPKGSFDGQRQSFTIATNDQLSSAAAFSPIIVAYRNNAPVRLGDLGEVLDGAENARLAGWYNGQPAVILDVLRQPGANIIGTVDRIKALLPQMKDVLPPSVKINILTDRTETIRASVKDVQFTLLLTVVLVVGVIFLFLRKFWATVIPGVALPLSLVATFGVMALVGYSLDNLSLMALTISAGFIVDDAIVMIENIVRYIEQGKKPFEAALEGAARIGFAILSLTVSLIAVFIPLLFMTGIVGRLFREFAVTLAIAVAISAVVSLTLTPMMCSRLLKAEHEQKEGRFGRTLEAGFTWLLNRYEGSLRWVLQRQKTTLGVALLTLVATLVLYVLIPKGFLPQQDTGLLIGTTEAAQTISFPAMVRLQQDVAERIRSDPDVTGVASFVGAGTVNPTANVGRLDIQLKNRADRSASATAIMDRLRQKMANVPGMTLYLQEAQDIQVETRPGRTQYQYTLVDADVEELRSWAPRVLDALKQQRALSDVTSDQQSDGNQLNLIIDRAAAGRLNVLPQAIDDVLYDAFGQRQVSIIYSQLNQYRVVLEVEPTFASSPDAINHLFVPSLTGQQIPLNALVQVERGKTPLAIPHQGQFPAVTLSFNLAPGHSLGEAVKAIRNVESELKLPEAVQRTFSGVAAEFQTSLASEPFLLLAAIIVVYIVLGVLYESYIHPLTILSTLPSAGVGALLSLWVLGQDLSLVALIGIVLLIGIVKKNAIMMIDFALEAERERHMSPEESIFQACLLRFRPIMMTTMAALLGAVPLALGNGTGSELRRPLGISIIGGLLVSQFLTLYTTPVIYLYLDRFSRGWASRRGHRKGEPRHEPQVGTPLPAVTE